MSYLELKSIISSMEFADKALEYLNDRYYLFDVQAESIIRDAFRDYDLFVKLCSVIDHLCEIHNLEPKFDDFF